MKHWIIVTFMTCMAGGAVAQEAMQIDENTVRYGDTIYRLSESVRFVDGNPEHEIRGKYAYRDFAEAVRDANKLKITKGNEISSLSSINDASDWDAGNLTLLIAPWVYWLDDPDDPAIRQSPISNQETPYALTICCDSLRLIGLSADPQDVVLAVNRGQTQGAIGNFTMFDLQATDVVTENLTMGNYCNVDLEYPLNPSLNRPKRASAIVQAQIALCHGTKTVTARNCRFISRLNLCPMIMAERTYYEDCHFECTDDALNGAAVYNHCHFTWHSTKPFYSTGSTGAILLDCDIDLANAASQYFTKSPGMLTVIDTRFHRLNPDGSTMQLQWTRDESPVVSYQSNISLDGEPCVIDAERPHLSASLDGTPLMDAYKVQGIYNLANLLGSKDGWDPANNYATIRELEMQTGQRLIGLPVAMRTSQSSVHLSADSDAQAIQIDYRLWGDEPAELMQGVNIDATEHVKANKLDDKHINCIYNNSQATEIKEFVHLRTDYGLEGAVHVTMAPRLLDAPHIVGEPSFSIANGAIVLSHQLDNDSLQNSYVRWLRVNDAEALSVREGAGCYRYQPSGADRGYDIVAEIYPQCLNTKRGKGVRFTVASGLAQPIIDAYTEECHFETDFSDIPLYRRSDSRPGFWTFDAYKPADTAEYDWTPTAGDAWYYGRGYDGAAQSIGLSQTERGARMFYNPQRNGSEAMSLSCTLVPCKPAGQGFGSATGQYMEIYIKYDPASQTGYALRIQRTAEYDRAVVFTLMRHDHGVATPISASVASGCFRSNCTVRLTYSDGLLTASASSDDPVVSDNPAVGTTVSLSAQASPLPASSLGIQHTGTTGPGATLITTLSAHWQ